MYSGLLWWSQHLKGRNRRIRSSWSPSSTRWIHGQLENHTDKTETWGRKEKKKEISHHVQIITTCCFSSTSDKTKSPLNSLQDFRNHYLDLNLVSWLLTSYVWPGSVPQICFFLPIILASMHRLPEQSLKKVLSSTHQISLSFPNTNRVNQEFQSSVSTAVPIWSQAHGTQASLAYNVTFQTPISLSS